MSSTQWQNPLNAGWLARSLKRMEITPVLGACVTLLVYVAIDVTCALLFNAWSSSAKGLGLLTDPTVWLYDFLIQPTILGSFVWVQASGRQLFEDLVNEGVFQPPIRLITVNAELNRMLQRRALPIAASFLSLIIVVTYACAFVVPLSSPSPGQSWLTTHPGIVLLRLPIAFVLMYALIVFICDLMAVFRVLNRLFVTYPIRVSVLHPDNAGGLGSIGSFTANIGFLIGVVGVALSIEIARNPSGFVGDYWLLSEALLYVALAPVVFIVPVWAAHKKMLAYRNHLLREISVEFDTRLAELQSLHAKASNNTGPIMGRIRQAEIMHKRIEKSPVWPVNLVSIRKIIGLVVSPLLPGMISILVDFISKLLS